MFSACSLTGLACSLTPPVCGGWRQSTMWALPRIPHLRTAYDDRPPGVILKRHGPTVRPPTGPKRLISLLRVILKRHGPTVRPPAGPKRLIVKISNFENMDMCQYSGHTRKHSKMLENVLKGLSFGFMQSGSVGCIKPKDTLLVLFLAFQSVCGYAHREASVYVFPQGGAVRPESAPPARSPRGKSMCEEPFQG